MPDQDDLIVPLPGETEVSAERVGPKAATLARLHEAGLRVPAGFCVTAHAYRAQIAAAGVGQSAQRVTAADGHDARKLALQVRLGLLRAPLADDLSEALEAAYACLGGADVLVAVRSSALLEDSPTASFAGQFESFLGIATTGDLVTAVRACWASLWSTRALRYMQVHDVDPGRTAMAVLVQVLVPARAAGGALSRTPEGYLAVTGTWGLGSAIAQGEVVPDRWILDRDDASVVRIDPGRKERVVSCSVDAGPMPRALTPELVGVPCLTPGEATELARMVLATEALLGMPVEMEWAKDDRGFQLLQARPLTVASPHVEDDVWLRHPGLRGHASGVGWSTGPARLVVHEHDLEHVGFGDILVTQVAGPALTAVLPRVAGVVAELGGSTSHLAALARERGIPAVLGVLDATRRIPEGATVAVDGVAGVVRWIA